MTAGAGACVCVEGSGHQVMLAMNQTARGGFGLKQSLFGVSHLARKRYLARKHTHTHIPRHSRGTRRRRGPPPDGVGGKGLLLKGGGKPFPPPLAAATSPRPRDTAASPLPSRQQSGWKPAPGRARVPPPAGRLRACAGCRAAGPVPCRAVPSRGTQEELVTHFLPPFAGGCSCIGSCCTEPMPSIGAVPRDAWASGLGERGSPRPGPAPPPRAQARPSRRPRSCLRDSAFPSLRISIAALSSDFFF